jgi:hypothetical protein
VGDGQPSQISWLPLRVAGIVVAELRPRLPVLEAAGLRWAKAVRPTWGPEFRWALAIWRLLAGIAFTVATLTICRPLVAALRIALRIALALVVVLALGGRILAALLLLLLLLLLVVAVVAVVAVVLRRVLVVRIRHGDRGYRSGLRARSVSACVGASGRWMRAGG